MNMPAIIHHRMRAIGGHMEINKIEIAAIAADPVSFENAWGGRSGLAHRLAIMRQERERHIRELDALCSAPPELLRARSRDEIRAATRGWPDDLVEGLILMSITFSLWADREELIGQTAGGSLAGVAHAQRSETVSGEPCSSCEDLSS